MRAHGHFDMWIDNQVLLARLKGQWNEEMATVYSDTMKELATSFNGEKWAHIVYLDDWELGTPEFEPIINELVTWVIEHGLIRTAQVYSPNMLKKFQMDRMVKEKVGDFERRIYPEELPAFSWLAEEGFPVQNEILIQKSA